MIISTLAPHVLNGYVWALLKANTSMLESQYGGKTPIIPSNQEPEFTAYNLPFLVYGFADDPSHENLAQRSGTLVYAIYATSQTDINKIYNIIAEDLGEYDISAHRINAWTTVPTNYANFSGCRFGSINVAFGEGPSPVDQEGGRQAANLTLRFNYVPTYPALAYTHLPANEQAWQNAL